MMRFVRMIFAFLLILTAALPLVAAGQTNDCALPLKAETAIAAFHHRSPKTLPYFEDAYAFVVYPAITRFGLGFGGAYGKGVVVATGQAIGTSKLWQFTSGIQAGVRNISTVIFFKDEPALRAFQSGNAQFLGQGGIALATIGLNGTPAYNDGVAIFSLTRFGLMAEFTISAAKFSYKDIGREAACSGGTPNPPD